MENSKEVKIYFEQVEKYLFREFGVQLRQELIHSSTGILSNKKILDIGCGNGDISIPFIKNNNVTFLDFSDGMLALVKSKIPKDLESNVIIKNQDFTKIDRGEKFDLVLFIGVMAHSPWTLSENLTHLKSLTALNGQIYIQFSDANHWITKLEYILRKGTYDVNRISKLDFEKAVNNAGFKIKKIIPYATILPGMGKIPNSMLYKYVSFITRFKLFSFMRSEYIFVLSC